MPKHPELPFLEYDITKYINSECIPFEISGFAPEVSENTPVLKVEGAIVDVDRFFYQADGYSDDGSYIADAVCRGDFTLSGRYRRFGFPKAIIGSKFRVEPEFRGQGYGSAFLRDLPLLAGEIERTWCGFFIQAHPYEKTGSPEVIAASKARLIKLYKKYGFKKIGKSDILWLPNKEKDEED